MIALGFLLILTCQIVMIVQLSEIITHHCGLKIFLAREFKKLKGK